MSVIALYKLKRGQYVKGRKSKSIVTGWLKVQSSKSELSDHIRYTSSSYLFALTLGFLICKLG